MSKKNQIERLIDKIEEIRLFIISAEKSFEKKKDSVHKNYRKSAQNLIHYLALRTFNLQAIQKQLAVLGVSSIESSEGYTLANIDNILRLLYLLSGRQVEKIVPQPIDSTVSENRLRKNTLRLFGESSRKNNTRIMVTMPNDAATNYRLIKKLLVTGMDVARINTAQGNPETWKAVIKNIKRAEMKTGKRCLLYMDLTGPRLRTGKVKIQVIKKKKKEKKLDYLLLKKGDILLIYKKRILGKNAVYDKKGNLKHPAKIAITLPEIFDNIKKSHKIWFDDGKIGGKVKKIEKDFITVDIFHAAVKGSKLRGGKGLNLPDTHLKLPSLTKADMKLLPFITRHADLVGYSFIRKPKDIRLLQKELKRLKRENIGLILKIENKEAFNALPKLLLEGMKSQTMGVMIARGDLAVEIGWQRIAEVQEQILWMCEAAHVPNIWATQVLEKLAKKGIPTRAEITDAAMAARAECVMLNKGPYIVEAVQTLDNILHRMKFHANKKSSTLRALKIARKFVGKKLQ